jgi:hypothetical protein
MGDRSLFSGKIGNGILFFIMGLILSPVATLIAVALRPYWGNLAILMFIGMIIWILLWLFLSLDAYWEAGGE